MTSAAAPRLRTDQPRPDAGRPGTASPLDRSGGRVAERPATTARDVTVRRVTTADTGRMRALRLEMLADSPLAFLETVAEAAARPHAEFAARIAGSATGADRGQFVADHAGRLVGHAGGVAAPGDPGVTLIFAVYLSPAWRGSGLLAPLIDAVAAWSRSCGRPELLLEVVVGNDRAVRAYERLGFTDTGVRVPHPTVPAMTELRMHRPASTTAAPVSRR